MIVRLVVSFFLLLAAAVLIPWFTPQGISQSRSFVCFSIGVAVAFVIDSWVHRSKE